MMAPNSAPERKIAPLKWVSHDAAGPQKRNKWERSQGWTMNGYRTKQHVQLSSSIAQTRGRKHSAAFASGTAQRSSYAPTHSLSHAPSAKNTKHVTAATPLYTPTQEWIHDPVRSSAAFRSKVPVHTKTNTHPLVPTAAHDAWVRQAIVSETFTPLHAANVPRAAWLRPVNTPASLERTGDRYSNVVSWSINTPHAGAPLDPFPRDVSLR